MVKKCIFNVYDKVSEAFLGDFVANNEKVAKKAIKSFCEKNSVDYKDVSLVKVIEYDSPVGADDLINFYANDNWYIDILPVTDCPPNVVK